MNGNEIENSEISQEKKYEIFVATNETVKDDNVLNLCVSTDDKIIANLRDNNNNNNKSNSNNNNNINENKNKNENENNIKSFSTTKTEIILTPISQTNLLKPILARTPTTSNSSVSTSVSTNVRANGKIYSISDEENENNPRKGLFFSEPPIFNQCDFLLH